MKTYGKSVPASEDRSDDSSIRVTASTAIMTTAEILRKIKPVVDAKKIEDFNTNKTDIVTKLYNAVNTNGRNAGTTCYIVRGMPKPMIQMFRDDKTFVVLETTDAHGAQMVVFLPKAGDGFPDWDEDLVSLAHVYERVKYCKTGWIDLSRPMTKYSIHPDCMEKWESKPDLSHYAPIDMPASMLAASPAPIRHRPLEEVVSRAYPHGAARARAVQEAMEADASQIAEEADDLANLMTQEDFESQLAVLDDYNTPSRGNLAGKRARKQ